MYRNRNLDIFIAGGTGLLGGAAYVVHVPGPIQVILGIALFFAPGYLWSEAILTQRLTGLERVLTSAGISLILPIIGGFLFYGLRIPLFRSAWVGLLVVLTLAGVVAVAIQRLREDPADARPVPAARNGQPGKKAGLPLVHLLVYAAAGVIALGTVAFSVRSADTQKFPGKSAIGMAAVLTDPPAANPIPTAPGQKFSVPTQANLTVTNNEGIAEQYEVKLLRKGKKTTTTTYNFTLANGQSWHTVIAYTVAQNSTIRANLYLLPDTSKIIAYADNGE
ncbi:MAG TPA: DUF1616 domain-containing protein [Trebonia sp.]|jgi:hypothetical protein|nr:DUF1616 domain-containing protein [Trebonia sp.]